MANSLMLTSSYSPDDPSLKISSVSPISRSNSSTVSTSIDT